MDGRRPLEGQRSPAAKAPGLPVDALSGGGVEAGARRRISLKPLRPPLWSLSHFLPAELRGLARGR